MRYLNGRLLFSLIFSGLIAAHPCLPSLCTPQTDTSFNTSVHPTHNNCVPFSAFLTMNFLYSICLEIESKLLHDEDLASISPAERVRLMEKLVLPIFGPQLNLLVCRCLEYTMRNISMDVNFLQSEDLRLIRYFGFSVIFERDVLAIFKSSLDAFVQSNFKGVYTIPVLIDIKKWVSSSLMHCVGQCFEEGAPLHLENELLRHSQYSLVSIRAAELFEIVADFPESTPAVMELHTLIAIPGVLSYLGKILRKSLQRRLLHAGAATSQILDFYVAMIRSFRLLDPSNMLLNYSAIPIRRYLVCRKDTIRCIVSSLTEGRDGLKKELRVGGSLEFGMDSDDEGETADMLWNPPRRALDFPGGSGSQEKDIIALLVSIYGTTDLFVNEYRSMLADRLLSNLDYNIDGEVATLELLKIRFGEEALHSCEVMLHDMDMSKRLNTTMKSKAGDVADCVIISDSYWPSLQVDGVRHHSKISSLLESYAAEFALAKKPMKLDIVPQLGQVVLALEFDDGSNGEFTVLPLQASLILTLVDGGKLMSQTDLAAACDISETEVGKRMTFWVSRGVVREINHTGPDCSDDHVLGIVYEIAPSYVHATDCSQSCGSRLALPFSQISDESWSGVSLEAQEIATLSTYETYIRGMLRGQESMHIERIHTLLRMMIGSSGSDRFDMTAIQLRKFLQSLVDVNKLEIVDGSYRLPK